MKSLDKVYRPLSVHFRFRVTKKTLRKESVPNVFAESTLLEKVICGNQSSGVKSCTLVMRYEAVQLRLSRIHEQEEEIIVLRSPVADVVSRPYFAIKLSIGASSSTYEMLGPIQ